MLQKNLLEYFVSIFVLFVFFVFFLNLIYYYYLVLSQINSTAPFILHPSLEPQKMSDHEKAIQIPSPRPQPQTSPNFDRPYGQVDHLSLGYLARHTKRHSPQLNLSPSPRQDDLPQFTQIQTKKHNLNIDIPTPIIQRKHHISQTGSLSPLNLSIDVPLADKIKWGVKLEESMNHIDHSEPKERKMRSISEDFPFPTQIDLLVIVVDAHTGLALPQATIQVPILILILINYLFKKKKKKKGSL